MDSAALLDLLGNENRRRILRLLARKPCYVTEISEYLGVSPKAVIEHLRKLETAGLIESHTDDQRRKYFHIARNLRLEVNVSPYGFATKSAYPASKSLNLNRCSHLTLEIQDADDDHDTDELLSDLARLEELENELSLAQRYVQGRMTDVLERITEAVGAGQDSGMYADVLSTVKQEPRSVVELANAVDAPPGMIEEVLVDLQENGLVTHETDGWTLATDE
jgi:ArsR family transcriptional regulator